MKFVEIISKNVVFVLFFQNDFSQREMGYPWLCFNC